MQFCSNMTRYHLFPLSPIGFDCIARPYRFKLEPIVHSTAFQEMASLTGLRCIVACPKCQSSALSTVPAEIRLYRNGPRTLSHL